MTRIPAELAHLDLSPHPEGGWFRELHRSTHCTLIDYLLPAGGFSAWHRVLGGEEVWNHHRGGRLALHLLSDAGYERIVLGEDRFSAVVPADCWQAAEALDDAWVLVGCTVAPPFEFARFEMATEALAAHYPDAPVRRLIRGRDRDNP